VKKRRKNFEDLSGKKFGTLTVLSLDEDRSNAGQNKYWICICECGAVKSIFGGHLKAGKIVTCGNRSIHNTGSNNSNWKGGKTSEIQFARTSKEYQEWRDKVYALDHYTCQCCLQSKNINKEAHHMYNFSENTDLRFDVNYGITMCYNCHSMYEPGSFHHTYGTRNNTPEQLEEYINKKRKQLGIIIPFNIDEYIKLKNNLKMSNLVRLLNSDDLDCDFEEQLE
jgi:hypothetical protein